jgi:hypothetical protein
MQYYHVFIIQLIHFEYNFARTKYSFRPYLAKYSLERKIYREKFVTVRTKNIRDLYKGRGKVIPVL